MASVFVPSVPTRSSTTTGNTTNPISNSNSTTNPNLTILVAHGNDTNQIVPRSSKIPTPALTSTSISTLSTISIETVAASSTAVISQVHHACRRE